MDAVTQEFSDFSLDASASSTGVVVGARARTTAATAPSVSLPSPRHGSQSYFWTRDWQQRERLADFDFLIGDVYRPTDVEDLIRFLDDDDDEA